jgi:hypothetical protein
MRIYSAYAKYILVVVRSTLSKARICWRLSTCWKSRVLATCICLQVVHFFLLVLSYKLRIPHGLRDRISRDRYDIERVMNWNVICDWSQISIIQIIWVIETKFKVDRSLGSIEALSSFHHLSSVISSTFKKTLGATDRSCQDLGYLCCRPKVYTGSGTYAIRGVPFSTTRSIWHSSVGTATQLRNPHPHPLAW